MKRVTKIAIGAVTALTLGLATAVVSAQPYGYGPQCGMGQGFGYGPGAGMGPGMGPMGRWSMGYGPMGPGMGPMGRGRMGYGPMGPGMGPMGRWSMGYGPMGPGMGPQAWGNPTAVAESRLAGLKSELKITAAQESAWKAYSDQAKQHAEAMQALMSSAQGSAQATAPERIELRNQVMKKRQEEMEKTTTAFKDLYAVLTPEQKTLADQRVGMMGCMWYGV
ncbi:MAG: Spy/CpxP family protein refolding chaperone [Pseudomonadota bacterium]